MFFLAGSVSPVKLDSSIDKSMASNKRISAGTEWKKRENENDELMMKITQQFSGFHYLDRLLIDKRYHLARDYVPKMFRHDSPVSYENAAICMQETAEIKEQKSQFQISIIVVRLGTLTSDIRVERAF